LVSGETFMALAAIIIFELKDDVETAGS
jgi:hypothetical protein